MKLLYWTKIWFKAARAPFLVVSLIPAILGGVIAWKDGIFDWTIFTLTTVAIVLAHSAADFIDDYFDYKNGNLGNKEQQFHDSPLISGEITPKQVIWATIICLVPALGIGVYLFYLIGLPVLLMAALGTFIVFFYTSPPFRLNYRGVGESALFLAFGPMIVFGVYYVITQQFSWEPILLGIPLGIFTMNVGLVSNTFDYEDDIKSAKKTFPVRFGQANAVKLLNWGTILAFAIVVVAAIFKEVSLLTLTMLLLTFIAYKVSADTTKYKDLSKYTKAMGSAIALSSLAGIVLTIAYVGEILLLQ
jgi:1,4-dihydroxy-2-naphthoate octaprenyltransferase